MSSANGMYYHSNSTSFNSTQYPIRVRQSSNLVSIQPNQSTNWNGIDYSYDQPYDLSKVSNSADDYLFTVTPNHLNSTSVSLSWQTQPTDLSKSSMQYPTSIINQNLHDSKINTTMVTSTYQNTENRLPSLTSTNARNRRKKFASRTAMFMKPRTNCQCPNCIEEHGNRTFSPNGRIQHVCHVAGCGKTFDWPSFLQIHLRKHCDHRPFSCTLPMCEKKFKSKEELVRHTRVHTGEKNFVCPHCESKFQRSDHLDKHIFRIHEKK